MMEGRNNRSNPKRAGFSQSGGGDENQDISLSLFLPVHHDSSRQSRHITSGHSIFPVTNPGQQPSRDTLCHQPVTSVVTQGQRQSSAICAFTPTVSVGLTQSSAPFSNGNVAQQFPATFLMGQYPSNFLTLNADAYNQRQFQPAILNQSQSGQIVSYSIPPELVVYQPEMYTILPQTVPVLYTNSFTVAPVQGIGHCQPGPFGAEKQTTDQGLLDSTMYEQHVARSQLSDPFPQQLYVSNDDGHVSASQRLAAQFNRSRKNAGLPDSVHSQQQANPQTQWTRGKRRKTTQTALSSSRLANRNQCTAQPSLVPPQDIAQLVPLCPPDQRYAEQCQSSFYNRMPGQFVPTSFRGLRGDHSPWLNKTSVQVSLDTLPSLAILNILSYLSIQDLVLRVRMTCRYLYEISHDPSLWTHVNVSRVEKCGKRQVFITGLLEQNCYIAGREDPHVTEDERDLDAMSSVQTQNSRGMPSFSTVTNNAKQTEGDEVCAAQTRCTEAEYLHADNSNQTDETKALTKQQRREGKPDTMLSVYTEETETCRIDLNQSGWRKVATGFQASSQRHSKDQNVNLPSAVCTGEEKRLDEACKQTTQKKKRVKDYIRRLHVNSEPQIAPVSFVCSTEKRNEIVTVVNHSLTLPSHTVCPRLDKLAVNCVTFELGILTTVAKHHWLTELSVTVLNRHSRFTFKITEDDLAACYEAFRMLKHLKKFQFLFPIMSSFNNNLVGNILYFNTDRLYASVRKFFETVTNLEDIVVSAISDSVIGTIRNSCSKLKRLAFNTHSFSKNGFVSGKPVSTLQSLTISSTLSSISSDVGSEIAKVFPNLRSVNLTGVHITNEGLEILLKTCTQLEIVHLYNPPHEDLPVTGRAYLYALPTLSHLFDANRTPLKELSVLSYLGDTFVHNLCTHNVTLTSLTLSDCPDLTDAALVTVANLCPHLTHFKLTQEQSNVSAQGVLRLVQNGWSLTKVDVSSLNSKGRFVPNGDSDRLTESWHDPWDTPEQFYNSLETYSNSSSTAAAYFRSWPTRNPTNNSQLLGRNLYSSAQARGDLDCSSITSSRLTVTMNGEYLPHIVGAPALVQSKMREFSLGRVPQMTHKDLLVLVRVCPDLVELHLSGCLALTDSSVAVILRGYPRLRTLTLNRQARGLTFKPCRVTDLSLHLLARYGRRLQHFRALNCYKFSPLALAHLLVHSESLETLTVTLGKFHVLKNFADVKQEVQQMAAARSPPLCLKMGFREDLTMLKRGRARGRVVKVTILKKGVQERVP